MEIVAATYADSWGIEELLMQYQEEVIATNPNIFDDKTLDREKLTNLIVSQMDDETIHMTVVRHHGKVVAFLRALEHVFFFTSQVSVEMDMIFISQNIRRSLLSGRAFVALMRDFENWARERNARILSISSLSGLKYKEMNEAVERHGFETVGFNCVKRMEAGNG